MACNIKPLNGLKYRGRNFDNDYTFIRSTGKSQIDLCLTNSNGRTKVQNFNILLNNWHISDHRPIALSLKIDTSPDLYSTLKRAVELNYESKPTAFEIQQLKGNYDYVAISNSLVNTKNIIENDINVKLSNNNIFGALDVLDEHIKSAHHCTSW